MAELSRQSKDKLLQKLPPSNVQAEQAVLGCALFSADYLPYIIGNLKTKDFYKPEHRSIYEVIRGLSESSNAVDLITVSNALESRGQLAACGGLEYLSSLTDSAPLISNYEHYTRIVREKAILRELIMRLTEVVDACYTDSDEVETLVELASKRIFEIREGQDPRGFQQLGTVLGEHLNELLRMVKYGDSDRSIPSGFPILDSLLGGLRNGALYIVAARPGMGKSAFALNIAQQVAELKRGAAAIFSLEMTAQEIAVRFLASKYGVNSKNLADGSLNESEWNDLAAQYAESYALPMFIDDRAGSTSLDMLARCRQLKMERGLSVVVIDYLQLMSGERGRSENRQQEISDISRSLKVMARELNVPVIALSQLSRSCETRTDKRPMLSDLRDSGAIEQDADAVLFLYRDAYYSDAEKDKSKGEDHYQSDIPADRSAELIIAKNRHGAIKTIYMEWDAEHTLFREQTDGGYGASLVSINV